MSSTTATRGCRTHIPLNHKEIQMFNTDYDYLGFEERDEIDAAEAIDLREVLTGLPARPGTLR